jgi:hypothetical protein
MSKTDKFYLDGSIQKIEVVYSGLFVLNTNNKDTAKAWLMKDPIIKHSIFDAELYTWYESAVLPAYLIIHEKISKKSA